MEQFEDLQHRQVTEFKVEQQQEQQQQQQQMNSFLQQQMMEQQMKDQQQEKRSLRKDRDEVSKNMPEKLKEKKASTAATPFSPEMNRQLEVIIRDKENASAYYQPILKLSRMLLATDLEEGGKVELFGKLMENMTFYLNHHAETESPDLAERRRALCQRTIKGSMLFVAQAPPEYALALKEGLQKLSGSEREAIVNMQSEELKKGFLDYLNEASGENPEDEDPDKKPKKDN